MFSELSRDLLGIYLNDHLAGATGGVDLARASPSLFPCWLVQTEPNRGDE